MAVARALSRIAERTKDEGGERARPHDLRRSFRTMLSRIGVAPHIAELCLGHVEGIIRRVYDGTTTAAKWQMHGTGPGRTCRRCAVAVPGSSPSGLRDDPCPADVGALQLRLKRSPYETTQIDSSKSCPFAYCRS